MIAFSTNRKSRLPLFFISALPESGGGYTARLFDAHPELWVYPFEMQLGTQDSSGKLIGYCFQSRYRWPRLKRKVRDAREWHDSIADRELKWYLTNRKTSKFKGLKLDLAMPEWMRYFQSRIKNAGKNISRSAIIEFYVTSLFESWKNRKKSNKERAVLGHCPMILYDAQAIFSDFPNAKMLHLIRNPVSTFHDTSLRIPRLNVPEFAKIWKLTALLADSLARKYPGRFLTARYEDLISKKKETLKSICRFFGIRYYPVLERTTWNGRPLKPGPPFGGIPRPSLAYERSLIENVSDKIIHKIKSLTEPASEIYGY